MEKFPIVNESIDTMISVPNGRWGIYSEEWMLFHEELRPLGAREFIHTDEKILYRVCAANQEELYKRLKDIENYLENIGRECYLTNDTFYMVRIR